VSYWLVWESLRFFFLWLGESLSSLVVSLFLRAFFLSHCWWRYRNKMFVFSVVMICSDGWSFVGRYTCGFLDEVRHPSAWNRLKFISSKTGNPFRYSDVDIIWSDCESKWRPNYMRFSDQFNWFQCLLDICIDVLFIITK